MLLPDCGNPFFSGFYKELASRKVDALVFWSYVKNPERIRLLKTLNKEISMVFMDMGL